MKQLTTFSILVIWLTFAVTANAQLTELEVPSVNRVVRTLQGPPPSFPTEVEALPPSGPAGPIGGPSGPRDRKVFFAHGLGGVRAAWGAAAPELSRLYEMEYDLIGYTDLQMQTINNVANTVVISLLPERSPEVMAKTLFVGHSLGGLIGREGIRQQELTGYFPGEYKYGGIATFDTPHGGAPIADRNAMTRFFEEGCDAITSGPLSAATAGLPWFVKFNVYDDKLATDNPEKQHIYAVTQRFKDTACLKGIFKQAFDFFLIDRALPRVADDIVPEADFIDDIAEYEPPFELHSAAISAYENQPAALKLFGSAFGKVASEDPWGAGDDSTKFMPSYDTMYLQYRAMAERQRNEAADVSMFPGPGYGDRQKKLTASSSPPRTTTTEPTGSSASTTPGSRWSA